MTVSASDILKESFGSLNRSEGHKIIAIFFILQAVNMASGLLTSQGQMMAVVGTAIGVFSGILGIIATVGGLRSFNESEFKSDFFKENIKWPSARIVGSQITAGLFAYLMGGIFLLPAIATVFMTGMSLSAGSAAIGSMGIAAILVSLASIVLGLAVFTYVSVTLILSQPLVAIEDKRMFQSLDESIRRTKDHRMAIFLAFAAIFLAYFGVSVVIGGVSALAGSPSIGPAVISLVVVPVFTAVTISLLDHIHEELPEP